MKRIVIVLLALLLAATVYTAAAEEPETEPFPEPWEELTEEPYGEPAEEPYEEPYEEPAGEPDPEPAPAPGNPEAPAEAGCPHAHTETVYYFDAPDYRPLNDESHAVIGQAVAETECLDCGAVIAVTTVDDAEEIRPHVFRNGRCALCGRESAAEAAAPAAAESVMQLSAAGEPNQYFCVLTGSDLEGAGETLVLRPEGRDTALAVQTRKLREEIGRAGGSFTAEIRNAGEKDISTLLCLYDASGEEMVPEAQGISLRIYRENLGTPLTVSFTNLNGATSTEEARWVSGGNEGYWIVTWLGDGLYQYN